MDIILILHIKSVMAGWGLDWEGGRGFFLKFVLQTLRFIEISDFLVIISDSSVSFVFTFAQ